MTNVAGAASLAWPGLVLLVLIFWFTEVITVSSHNARQQIIYNSRSENLLVGCFLRFNFPL